MKFNEKIMKLRKQKGLSQEEFANKLNVSRQAIYKWETEQSVPDIKNVQEICKIFNVSIEYLLNDDLNEDVPQEKHSSKKSKKFIIKSIFKFLIFLLIIYLVIFIIKFCLIKIISYRYFKNSENASNYSIMRGEEVVYDSIKHTTTSSKNCTAYFINSKTLYFYDLPNNNLSALNYVDFDNNIRFYLEPKNNNEYNYEDCRNEGNNKNLNNVQSKNSDIATSPFNFTFIEFSANPFSFATLNTVYNFSITDHSYYLYNFNDGLLENCEEKSFDNRYTHYYNTSFEYFYNDSDNDPISEDEFIQFACTDGRNVDYNILKSYIEKQQKAE